MAVVVARLALCGSDPSDVARRVGDALIRNSDTFVNWEGGWQYGGAVTLDGLHSASSLVPPSVAAEWAAEETRLLDMYFQPPTDPNHTACDAPFAYGPSGRFRACALAVMSPTRAIPWNASVLSTPGDKLGLFPTAYLARRHVAPRYLTVALQTAAE